MEIVSFSSVAENWLKNIESTVSKNTYSIYSGYIKNYMLPYLPADDIEDVNHRIEEYIDRIEIAIRADLVKK
jgi:hypothetical protein